MIKLNDHYFISWLNTVKQKRIHIRQEGIFVDIISSEYLSLLEEYSSLPLNDTTYKGATADDRVESGGATFRWNDSINDWILLQKDSVDTLTFKNFEGTIADGKITLPFAPSNNQIWDITVINSDGTIIAFPKVEDLTFNNKVVGGLSAYNGNIIRFEYAYGSQEGSSLTTTKDLENTVYNDDGTVAEFVYSDGSKKVYNRENSLLVNVVWTAIDGVTQVAKKTFIYENGKLKGTTNE